MSNRIYLPSTGPTDWRRLLAAPDKHWKDGYSAKCAAERWEEASGLPDEIALEFERASLGRPELLVALPEWKTRLPGGQRESQTDVLALVRTTSGVFACGVEAKVAEPFGPTVGEWLEDPSPGKRERLAFLCQTLGFVDDPPRDLRYQLFHRTAAALIEADRFSCAGAAVVIHSFSANQAWLADFQAFALALGAKVAPGAPAIVASPRGLPLLLAWACGPAPAASASGAAPEVGDGAP